MIFFFYKYYVIIPLKLFFKLTIKNLKFMFYLSCYFLMSSNFKFTNIVL